MVTKKVFWRSEPIAAKFSESKENNKKRAYVKKRRIKAQF
jgi:hypothetical protein